MERLLVAAVLLSFLGLTAAQGPPDCDFSNIAIIPGIPLPKLPATAFKTTVRAIIVNKNMTVTANEYVDESLQSATLRLTQNGKEYRIIMSYGTGEVFYVMSSTDLTASPYTCMTSNLTVDDNTQLFGFGTSNSGNTPGGMHLFSTSRILEFINGSEAYLGHTWYNGVPVNKWTSCVYWPELNSTFSLDYFFTVPGWKTPSGLDQVPVMAEAAGITVYPNGTVSNFDHVYEYIDFEPYVDDPETIFTTPPGCYCLLRKATKPPPTINNHFYYREEISSPSMSGQFVTESDIYYDYDMKLIRFDSRYIPSGASNTFVNSQGPYTSIHDYNDGVQYSIARDTLDCSIDPIPADSKGFDGFHNITRDTLTMRNPQQFFNLAVNNYLYAGQRMERGMQCDVYQNILLNFGGYQVVVYEVYFLAGGTAIPDRGSDAPTNPKAIPFRINTWAGGVMTNVYFIHDFDQYSAQAQSFDITPCFDAGSSVDFEIKLSGVSTRMNLMPALAPSIRAMLALQVALGDGTTPIRLQNTRLHYDQYNVYFQGTLVGAPPSIAKYEPHVGQLMAQTAGKALPNMATAQDCANQCDHLTEWNCNNFDFCPSTQVCTLGKTQTLPSLLNNTACTHYQRVLGGGSVADLNVTALWNKLKNNVYQGLVTFALPYPDAMGNVDLSADVAHMDDTHKVTLTAFDITDQVINSPNRDGYGSPDMNQFTVIRNKKNKGFQDQLLGVAVDDCAGQCVGETTFNCQAFHYCWDSGACFLTSDHPDEHPNQLLDEPACDVYVRDYTSNFDQYAGISVLSSSNTVYQNVYTPSQCAHLCMTYTLFHCESFDYCTDISACFLGQTHYYDTPKGNVQQAPSCVHFSRSYLSDFIMKSQKQVPLHDNRIVQMVSAAQCAKMCVEEDSFNCASFDYCGNYSECRLSDASSIGVGQITLDSSAYCDVYIRQYASGTAGVGALAQTSGSSGDSSSSSSSGPFSGGSMAGLAFGMILAGLVVGLVGVMLHARFFSGPARTSIPFSKQENEEELQTYSKE